jgi:hypothetical protein
MTFKKLFKIIPLLIFVAFALPVKSTAEVNSSTLPSDSASNAKILSGMISRVTEIQKMDKTNLSRAEKKDLKNELREMKHQASILNRGVYLSFGAIIIIILLLILLL